MIHKTTFRVISFNLFLYALSSFALSALCFSAPASAEVIHDPRAYAELNALFPLDSNCDTVKECACYEVCKDVCRIVNSEKVCDQSCNTICE